MNKTFKVGNMNIKTFQYKGQMINYYNKLIQNENLKLATCGCSIKYGWHCSWTY